VQQPDAQGERKIVIGFEERDSRNGGKRTGPFRRGRAGEKLHHETLRGNQAKTVRISGKRKRSIALRSIDGDNKCLSESIGSPLRNSEKKHAGAIKSTLGNQ